LRYTTIVCVYIVFDIILQYFGNFSFINFCAQTAFPSFENIPIQADPEPVILEK